MGDSMMEHALLVERLERLELQNRRLRQGGLICLVLIGSFFWMGQMRPVRILEAQKFVLRDASGKRQAELGQVDGSPALVFLDPAGRISMSFGMESEEPHIVIFGASAEKMVSITRSASGPRLALHDTGGAVRLNLSVGANGPAIGLLSKGGEARSTLGMTANEDAFMHLFGAREHGGVQLLSAPDRSVIRFLDEGDMPRAVLGLLEKEGAPGLVLNQSDGTARAILMLSAQGAELGFLNNEKGVVWKAP
jgi:hypothetical protein